MGGGCLAEKQGTTWPWSHGKRTDWALLSWGWGRDCCRTWSGLVGGGHQAQDWPVSRQGPICGTEKSCLSCLPLLGTLSPYTFSPLLPLLSPSFLVIYLFFSFLRYHCRQDLSPVLWLFSQCVLFLFYECSIFSNLAKGQVFVVVFLMR